MGIEFLLTSLIVVASPGTGVLFTLAAGLARGSRAGVVAAFGCTLGIVPHIAAAVMGLAALLHASALAFQALKYLGVAYLLYFRLVADVGPTRALTVTFLIPVFGMLWGALFLGEAITAPMLAGAALVLVGTGMILGVGARRAAAPAAAPRASGTERGERATAPNRATPPGRRR